jgi:molybdopterin-guanine dinucleotide biosynthesis protein A
MGHSSYSHADVVGVILAGGQSRRMGGDNKGLKNLGGKPMIAHVIERLTPQVGTLIINANGDPTVYAAFGLPVVPDVYGEFAGPLAGILTAMRWAQEHRSAARWIATAACDTPFLPADYVKTLHHTATPARSTFAGAMSVSGIHYVLGLWAVDLADDLAESLARGENQVQLWVDRHWHVNVLFPTEDGEKCDPFFNVNTPEDFAAAELRINSDEVR